jgi:hypothetical protein
MVARVLIAAVTLLLLLPTHAGTAEPTIAVIVHPERRVALSLDDLTQIYLRRRRFWDDNLPIVPLNLAAGIPLRAAFSRVVLQQSEARLAEHWNRQYFYGNLPPATLASTEAVRRYVASDRNAIGYVPASEVDESVHVVLQLE